LFQLRKLRPSICLRFFARLFIGALVTATVVRGVTEDELLPGIDGKWLRYESTNFELYSHQKDRESRAILHDLELLRAVFLEHFKFVERDRLDVTVFSFSRESHMKAYSPKYEGRTKEIGGLYIARPDRAVIMLGPAGSSEEARQVVFHEYIHHLFKSVGMSPPLWFNEGMAELMSAVKLEKEKVVFGQPLVGRLAGLQQGRLIPLGELFAAGPGSKYYQSKEHAGLFYAQSWALLHYWLYGKSKLEPAGVAKFLKLAIDKDAMAKTNIKSLFEECFEIDYREMTKQLERYVKRGRYYFGGVPTPEIAAADTYSKSSVSPGLIRLRLAELAVRVHGSSTGKVALLQATAVVPVDPRVFEVLGSDAYGEGDSDFAESYWARAVEAGSSNSAVLRRLAQYEWGKWFNNFNYDIKLPEEVAVRFRELLVRSINSEPEQEASYEMLVWLETFSSKPVLENVNVVQTRFRKLKDKNRTLLGLALFRAKRGMNDEAIKLIRLLGTAKLDDWTKRAAEITLARMEGKAVADVSLTSEPSQKAEGVARMKRNIMKIPSVPVPADL